MKSYKVRISKMKCAIQPCDAGHIEKQTHCLYCYWIEKFTTSNVRRVNEQGGFKNNTQAKHLSVTRAGGRDRRGAGWNLVFDAAGKRLCFFSHPLKQAAGA
jgi:hypothetical protein